MWPADSAHLRPVTATHKTGVGPFLARTHAWITTSGEVCEFVCEHRFMSPIARDNFAVEARRLGLDILLSEDSSD